MPKKIVITGGPGSGKTTLITSLQEQGYQCIHEISREITLEAQKQGIEQLFVSNPLLFSEKLIEGRLRQFQESETYKKNFLFYDRGLPDVTAYMDYFNTKYPNYFTETCNNFRYDAVFLLPPWEKIYKQDNERYESYEEAKTIHDYLLKGYEKYGYSVIEVKSGSIQKRIEYILKKLNSIY